MRKGLHLGLVFGGTLLAFVIGAWIYFSEWPNFRLSQPMDSEAKDGVSNLLDGQLEPPEWLVTSVPFDVRKHFKAPPPEQNAAPLYLDALFEFSSDVKEYFSIDEQARRTSVAQKRRQRILPFFKDRTTPLPPDQVPELDAALLEYGEGFEKIRRAQERPTCLFFVGGDVSARFPYALAIRDVARIADLQTQRDLEQGQFDQVIERIETMLRLCRDMQQRSVTVCQLVCNAVDNLAFDSIKRVLATPEINTAHCDRLLAVMQAHEAFRLNADVEAAQSEYIMQRLTLQLFSTTEGRTQLQRSLGAKDNSRGEVWLAMCNSLTLLPNGRSEDVQQIDAVLQNLDGKAEIAAFDHVYRRMREIAARPYAERAAGYREVGAEVSKKGVYLSRVLAHPDLLLPGSYVRQRAKLAGMIGLIALRRWQLTHSAPPGDLEQIVAAAGIAAMPKDPYGDVSPKLGVVNGELVIYSVGPDGQDDHAELEWDGGKEGPGDYVFRLRR